MLPENSYINRCSMCQKDFIGHKGYVDCRECSEKQLQSQLAEAERSRDEALALCTVCYNSGWEAGHHNTVEGSFHTVYPADFMTYHSDVVDEIFEERNSEALAALKLSVGAELCVNGQRGLMTPASHTMLLYPMPWTSPSASNPGR